MSVRDAPSLRDAWVVRIFSAYEPSDTVDRDPNHNIPGVVYRLASGAELHNDGPTIVFTEVLRDRAAYAGDALAPKTKAKDIIVGRIVFHESVHRFNLQHDTPPGDERPLSFHFNLFGEDKDNRLTPAQLHVIRGVAKRD